MSSSNDASRWAMPQRRWRRPTRRDVISTLLLLVTVSGAVLVLTGDPGALVISTASMLGGYIGDLYKAQDETPYAKGFSQPPDAPTQRLIHEHLARGQLPADQALHALALEYASGWSRRLKRFLLLAPLVASGWCLICLLITWWFNHRWPESASTRTWGFSIAAASVACWLACFVPPAVKQHQRLRRLT